jgi:hypothetical protein
MMWTASQLSRFCAHHRLLSNLNPRPTRDKAAAKGTAFHAALKEWHDTGRIPPQVDGDVIGWLDIMIENGWTWPDGVELEVAWGLNKWGMFSPVEEKPEGSHVYVSLDGEPLITAGRADACWMVGDVLVSVDWKTGRTLAPPAWDNLQVNAAGVALAQKWKARAYQPGIYYAREGRWDMGEEVDLRSPGASIMAEAIETAAALDDQPHPGPHCGACWERKNCAVAA